MYKQRERSKMIEKHRSLSVLSIFYGYLIDVSSSFL
jgi:hypothetical protein